ncbi:hypothetical protein DFQ26_008261 [Actinomortierella ambigua]|nr:hypothetical protein DFQ26_008261 [Actinomortierella ambigua]
MSVFPPSTIKDIAEAVGIPNLKDDVAGALAQDVEYRIHEIVQEAMKFMRHSKRTKLTVDDINNALRVRNVEPLYGFNSSESSRFRKTTVGTAATGMTDVYFVEDEELDFEGILSTPLPKVPLDVTFTSHWLAIEGVQPAIPQNPTPSDAKADLLHKRIKLDPGSLAVQPGVKAVGAGAGANPGSGSGASNAGINHANASGGGAEIKPLVKHVLSKELQMYYERIANAALSQDEVLRATGISSLQNDPGLHQLLPYFVQLAAEKVTTNLRNLTVLESMMAMLNALLENNNLFVEPYLHQIMPTVLTCLVAKRLGESPQENHWALRESAANIILLIINKYGTAYHTLQPRVARTLLHAFLDPEKPFTTHYGAVLGLSRLGPEVFNTLVVPNLKTYSTLLEPYLPNDAAMDEDLVSQEKTVKRKEAEHCFEAIVAGLTSMIKHEATREAQANPSGMLLSLEAIRAPLVSRIGEAFANAVLKQEGIELHILGFKSIVTSL